MKLPPRWKRYGIWDRKGRDLKLKEVYERTAKTEGAYNEP
jgi:hypothetical protein